MERQTVILPGERQGHAEGHGRAQHGGRLAGHFEASLWLQEEKRLPESSLGGHGRVHEVVENRDGTGHSHAARKEEKVVLRLAAWVFRRFKAGDGAACFLKELP